MNVFHIGIGYVYLGQTTKGIATFLLCAPVLICLIIATGGLIIMVWWLVYVAAAIDAYKIGQKLQRGEAVGEWELFPS